MAEEIDEELGKIVGLLCLADGIIAPLREPECIRYAMGGSASST
jgi:hypothetical protein